MNATRPRAVGLLLLTVMIPMAVGPAAAYTGQQLARRREDHHRSGARELR